MIIENAPPGQWDEWGIGYRQLRELNPRLIYCWVGQRGQWGPLKDKPGMLDPIAQSACGFVHGTGDPKEFGGQPTRSALWMADHVGGSCAAMGILAALMYRENVSGEGQFVEATSAEAIIRILDYSWAWYSMDGSIRPRYGNWDLAINIYAVNPCKDGYMMVGGGHDRLWYRIWRTVGDEYPAVEEEILGDQRLREVADRLAHDQQVKTYTLLGEWLKDNPRSDAERKLSQAASGVGRRALCQRGGGIPALQVSRTRGRVRVAALREDPLRHHSLPAAQDSWTAEMAGPPDRLRQPGCISAAARFHARRFRAAAESPRHLTQEECDGNTTH